MGFKKDRKEAARGSRSKATYDWSRRRSETGIWQLSLHSNWPRGSTQGSPHSRERRTRGRTRDSRETEQKLQNPRIQDRIVLNCLPCHPTWEAPFDERTTLLTPSLHMVSLITTDLQTKFSCRSSWLTQRGGLSDSAKPDAKSFFFAETLFQQDE